MASVRVAVIGQTHVNRPIFEIQTSTGRHVLVTDENDRIVWKPREFLKTLGVSTKVSMNYRAVLDSETRNLLRLDSNLSADRTQRFGISQNLGSTGLAFVSEFSPRTGWAAIYPTGGITYEFYS